MTTVITPNFIEAAQTLKSLIASVQYQYSGEQVNESVMREHIEQMDATMTALTDEDLANRIEWVWDSQNSGAKDATEELIKEGNDVDTAVAKAVVSDICHDLVDDMTYETVVFILD